MFVKHRCGCVKWSYEKRGTLNSSIVSCQGPHDVESMPMTEDEVRAVLLEISIALAYCRKMTEPMAKLKEIGEKYDEGQKSQ